MDLAHLRYVHLYDAVKPVGETTVDGAYLLTRFDFKRRRRIAGFTDLICDISATAHIHGLGYSFVEVVERAVGMHSRLWVLATPVDGEVIDPVPATHAAPPRARRPAGKGGGVHECPERVRAWRGGGRMREHRDFRNMTTHVLPKPDRSCASDIAGFPSWGNCPPLS